MDVTKYHLGNGLKVLLQENHNAPVVSMQAWVNVGSASESDEDAGISHFIEHLLFKGTKKRGVGEIAKEVEKCGGDINAFTSFDNTVYKIDIASRFYEQGLDVISDMLSNSLFDKTEIEKEKEVVLEEIKRGEDNPSDVASKKMFALAYNVHTYRRPVIGFEKVIKNATREQILSYFNKWYSPKNMTLVVVGDFKEVDCKKFIEEKFLSLPANEKPISQRATEPAQTSGRFETGHGDFNEAYLYFAYPIPNIKHDDIYPLDIFSIILGQGESSRLNNKLKLEKQLVNMIGSSSFTPKDPGLFFIDSMILTPNIEETYAAVLNEINNLKVFKITEEELSRAKISIEKDFVYQSETVQGQTRKLAFFEVEMGDHKFEKEYLSKILNVTREDVLKTTQKYFDRSKLNVFLMLPNKDQNKIDKTKLIKWTDHIESKHSQLTSKIKSQKKEGPIINLSQKGKTCVVFKENHHAPMVSIRASFLSGIRYENLKNNGISNFIAQMLSRGTHTRSALEIAQEIESLGGAIKASSGRNSICISMDVLSKNYQKALKLFFDVMLKPSFDEREIKKIKLSVLEDIKSQEDYLPGIAFRLFSKAHYGKHPYSLDTLGTTKTVKSFNQQQLIKFYYSSFNAGNIAITTVGDIDPIEANSCLQENLKQIKSGKSPNFSIPERKFGDFKLVEEFKDKKQAHVVLGFPSSRLLDKSKYYFEVLSSVLSGQSGRLFLELRDKQSLAYSLTSLNIDGIEKGHFCIYVGTSPDKVNTVLSSIKREIDALKNDGIDQGELERAKNYIVGNYEIDMQSNSSQASNIVYNELYGLGSNEFYDYTNKILKVTKEDAIETARKYFDWNKCTIAVVRPKDSEEIIF